MYIPLLVQISNALSHWLHMPMDREGYSIFHEGDGEGEYEEQHHTLNTPTQTEEEKHEHYLELL